MIAIAIAMAMFPHLVFAVEEVSLFYQRREEIEAIVKLLDALTARDGTRVRVISVSESQVALAELRRLEGEARVSHYSPVELFMDGRYVGGVEEVELVLRKELGLPERDEIRTREAPSHFRNEILTDTASGGGKFRGQVQVADTLRLGAISDRGIPSEARSFKAETFVLQPMTVPADLDTSKTFPPTVVPPITRAESVSRTTVTLGIAAVAVSCLVVFLVRRRLRRSAEGTALAQQRAV